MSKQISDKKEFLKSLGKLDENFSQRDSLIEWLDDNSNEIRYLSAVNLAKLSDISLLELFKAKITSESSSKIRRELASAIGRMRSEECIPTLIDLLKDKDPNIILQAIRGLLVFKSDKKIISHLKRLKKHQNEIVKKVIEIEFSTKDQPDKSKVVEFPSNLKNTAINGDVLKVLKKVEDLSIHLTFTSPPYYNARDYSTYSSYDQYINFLKKVFLEIHRITKEGRFFALNTSPIIIPRAGRKYSSVRYPIPFDLHTEIVNMGWEYVDDIVWLKPEPSAKNRVAGFNMHRKPLAYKPNCVTEQIMIYRKRSTKLIDWIFDQYPDEVIEDSKVKDGYESSNVWKIDPSFNRHHSAVFPIELCDRIIKYYSFKGDLVFDPFAGSGSLGISAIKNDRFFFLTELDKTYYQVMLESLSKNLFFGKVSTKL